MFETLTVLLFVFAVAVSFQYVSVRKQWRHARNALIQSEEAPAAWRQDLDDLAPHREITDVAAAVARQRDDLAAEAAAMRESTEQLQAEARDAYAQAVAEAAGIRQKAYDECEALYQENKERMVLQVAEATEKVTAAYQRAADIEREAHQKAQALAGDALDVLQRRDHYEALVDAMKHTIDGYGDTYLIPRHCAVKVSGGVVGADDPVAALQQSRQDIRTMITLGQAVDCHYLETERRQPTIALILAAFNGSMDAIMAEVQADNEALLRRKIEDAYLLVNHTGEPFQTRITETYYQLMQVQLTQAVAVMALQEEANL